MKHGTKPQPARVAAARRAHRIVRAAELLAAGAVVLGGIAAVHLLTQRATAASASTATARAPFRVKDVTPATGAVGVAPTAAVVIRFSDPIAPGSPLPSISPALPGRWLRIGTEELRFVPSVPALPLATETLSVPGGRSGMLDAGGRRLAVTVRRTWQVRNGSILRMQQVLAMLGYLPLTWTGAAANAAGGGQAADLEAFYQPPAGRFAWRYPATPAPLRRAWRVGADNRMTAGAMVAFERKDGLPAYTSIRPVFWATLLAAERAGQTNPEGYTYALVSQAQPESLTLWHDGRDVYTSVANTGGAQTPTATGTYFVYLRFASTTMQGHNPNGSYYIDHGVRWVNYFDGGDAIHGFIRASYGFPQSLGCVELPVANAAVAWKWIHYGTLVTVLPAPVG